MQEVNDMFPLLDLLRCLLLMQSVFLLHLQLFCTLLLEFYEFVRPERIFPNLEELKTQIEKDIEYCKRI